ncbi:MAG TPA: selenocysteine-specific translation elongation factor [Candidatus Kryptonia bacterium]|nr:selenocysteine-specific translation elongation factor [Candidatus Kryptonia bacterium]
MTPHVILGTAGHIDHGKTALIKALTGQDTDRLKEEKERGISIDLGFAHLDLDGGVRVGIVDVPGHERFIRNMLAGAHGIDLALLVIAADDGVMPQTEEHVDILHLLGTRSGVVALTKTDLVDPARIAAVREEIEILLAGTTLEGAPVFPVSSVTGTGLRALRSAIQERLGTVVRADRPGLFRLPIDRAFVLHGHGVVVTGTAISGTVREGDTVRILPGGETARVRSVHVHNEPVAAGAAGQRVALNLSGVERTEVVRGHVACDPALDRATDRLDAWVEIRPGPRHTVESHGAIRLFSGTADVIGKLIVLDDRSALGPGDAGFAQLVLREPVAALRGDRFVLRDEASQRTVGGGVVVHAFAHRHRRNDGAVLGALATIHAARNDAAVVESVIGLDPAFATAPDTLVQAAHLTSERLQAVLQSDEQLIVLPSTDAPEAVTTRDKWEQLRSAAIAAVDACHRATPLAPGIEMESVRSHVAPDLSPKIFRAALDRLSADGALARDDSVLRLPAHRVAFDGADRKLAERAEQLLTEGGLTPPDLKQIEAALAVPRARLSALLQQLERERRVQRIAPDLYYAAAAIDHARTLLGEHCAVHGEITAATFRDLINASRKYSIALLDYFDRTGFTLRVGDARKLRR